MTRSDELEHDHMAGMFAYPTGLLLHRSSSAHLSYVSH